jgi:hypothetical protein
MPIVDFFLLASPVPDGARQTSCEAPREGGCSAINYTIHSDEDRIEKAPARMQGPVEAGLIEAPFEMINPSR